MHDSRESEIDMSKLSALMTKHHSKSAPILTLLYKLAITAGYASARVECLFSALTTVDAPQRRSMSTKREEDLTLLHFENKTLMELKFTDFLNEWTKKPRRLIFH